jgi:hypothetical protein
MKNNTITLQQNIVTKNQDGCFNGVLPRDGGFHSKDASVLFFVDNPNYKIL